ncbi:MFS transporter [Paenibacillus sp. NPDC058071]|uniref:MFS transporter n=1 Tax=Paenibacillus sp. NPDC058071 TaxID=3346326 RepID=UPI0036D90F5E
MSLLFKNRSAILLLMINIFLVFTAIGLIVPVMPAYMNMLHINGTTVGLLVAAFSLTQLLLSPLAGRLSDTYGRKQMIIIGMVIFTLSELVFGLANSAIPLFIGRMLGGVGAALIMPAVMAYTADVTSMEERGKGMGFINAAISTGFIIGPGIGGFLAEYGIRVPFYAAAVAGAFAAVITAFILPASKPAASSVASAVETKKEGLAKQLLYSYRQPYFLSLIIVCVSAFGLANYETVYGLFVDHKFGFTTKDIAFIITFGSIAGAVVQATIFGWILNKFGEKNVIALCLLFSGLFIFLTLFAEGYWVIVTVTFIVFLAIDILRPAIGTQMSRMANEQQGYVAGLNSAFTSLGNIAGPIVAGFLFDIDINFPYMAAAAILILSFFLAVAVGRRDSRKAAGNIR